LPSFITKETRDASATAAVNCPRRGQRRTSINVNFGFLAAWPEVLIARTAFDPLSRCDFDRVDA
jgi:hypothetical protein